MIGYGLPWTPWEKVMGKTDPKPVSADMRTERGDRLRLEMCPHTPDMRRFEHGAPVKPKRYCDECIENEIRAAERAAREDERENGWFAFTKGQSKSGSTNERARRIIREQGRNPDDHPGMVEKFCVEITQAERAAYLKGWEERGEQYEGLLDYVEALPEGKDPRQFHGGYTGDIPVPQHELYYLRKEAARIRTLKPED